MRQRIGRVRRKLKQKRCTATRYDKNILSLKSFLNLGATGYDNQDSSFDQEMRHRAAIQGPTNKIRGEPPKVGVEGQRA